MKLNSIVIYRCCWDNNQNIDNRRKKILAKYRKKKASQGMTAAIIMIAFIITSAGIAFVILTMGSSMQQQLATTGERGVEAASSAMHYPYNIYYNDTLKWRGNS